MTKVERKTADQVAITIVRLLRSHTKKGHTLTSNGKLRDEIPNGEIFYSLKEANILIEQWRRHYNTIRPHSSIGYNPPASETIKSLPFQTTALAPERIALQ